MESDPTELFLPPSLPYPIKVVSLDSPVNQKVDRGTRLLSYSFVYQPKDPDAKPETRFGTWDSSVEGDLQRWSISVGDVLTPSKAKERPVVVIIEPCKHGIQLAGLCALCGKDLTLLDYTGFSDASRASIQMTHSAFGPTVSLEEAQRIERETANHLLNSRKLSLIVDLDQTIVHATVDPTVGEWIAEGEAWEAKQAKKQTKSTTPIGSDDSDDDSSDEEEECNPNWEAIKDVKQFRLGPESFANPSARSKGKHRMVENDGCMYYIKPRPGWNEFLKEASGKYELHVYTMGTRAYAEQVCAVIDPEKKIFGNRLLSRDESGSLTQKSLQRLFPCDTSMVVIIDDRADVWEWSPNLVKVVPYDFFVGIGDINSTFLPKVDPSTPAHIVPTLPVAEPEGLPSITVTPAAADSSTTTDAIKGAEVNGETVEENVLVIQNNAALEAQLEERPLAKKEKELQEHEEDAEQTPPSTDISTATASASTDKQNHHHHHRKPLLKNDDKELIRVGKLLNEVHRRYFTAYDARAADKDRHHHKSASQTSKDNTADVTRIIPRIRAETLDGCHILFSGLIPLDTKPETTEIWRSANMFGAKCHTELTNEVTHVVAAKRGTVKVDQARKRGNIAIVSQQWLTESIAQWQRMEERPYLLEEPAPIAPAPTATSPIGDATHQTTSDPEMDDDEDWEEEEYYEHKGPGALQLNTIDWSNINDEVEAAMNESDDDDDDDGEEFNDETRSERSAGGEATDDDSVRSLSPNNSPPLKRKRLRSRTPSESGFEGDDDLLRSPLAKRKRMAAGRSGLSRLKEGITASDLNSRPGSHNGSSAPASPMQQEQDEGGGQQGDGGDEEEDEDEEESELEDDFLARELEEEWG